MHLLSLLRGKIHDPGEYWIGTDELNECIAFRWFGSRILSEGSFRLKILFKDYSHNIIWGLRSSLPIPSNICLLLFGISSENAVVFEIPLILFFPEIILASCHWQNLHMQKKVGCCSRGCSVGWQRVFENKNYASVCVTLDPFSCVQNKVIFRRQSMFHYLNKHSSDTGLKLSWLVTEDNHYLENWA